MMLFNKQFMDNGRLVSIGSRDDQGVDYQPEVGDVCILKSGSFPMTIREVIADSAGNIIEVCGVYFNAVSGEYALMKLKPVEVWLHIPNYP